MTDKLPKKFDGPRTTNEIGLTEIVGRRVGEALAEALVYADTLPEGSYIDSVYFTHADNWLDPGMRVEWSIDARVDYHGGKVNQISRQRESSKEARTRTIVQAAAECAASWAMYELRRLEFEATNADA